MKRRTYMALPGTFEAKGSPTGKESFKKMQVAPGYEVVLDSKDILLCPTPGVRKSLISSSPRKTPRKSTSPIWKSGAFRGSPLKKERSTFPVLWSRW